MFVGYLFPQQDLHDAMEFGLNFIAYGSTEKEVLAKLKKQYYNELPAEEMEEFSWEKCVAESDDATPPNDQIDWALRLFIHEV